mmetsp:Transcript_9188/g.21148  ORF Transcript_9188/g.21148 Transcript_9188/m.21148 type:complete len:166 (-) Transcript_9188:540-1037(-)
MGLTEEQRERIRRNRERALEIRRRRKREEEATAASRTQQEEEPKSKRRRTTTGAAKEKKEEKISEEEDGNVELEEFEIHASPYVTKKEAMQTYCLPEGTLAVCEFVERENPHRKGWTPMKLFRRSEVRRRARKRFGGLEGLIAERKKREEKRFQKDWESTKDIFK